MPFEASRSSSPQRPLPVVAAESRTAWLVALAVAVTLLLGAGTSLAAGSKSEDSPTDAAEKTYNKGVRAMEKGDYAGAVAKFEKALAMDETLAGAHNNLAYSLRKQGKANFARALEHYDRAIELDPKLAQAYHYRGVLHALEGHEAEAKADHARLLELDRELADQLMKVIASGEEPEGHGGVAEWQ